MKKLILILSVAFVLCAPFSTYAASHTVQKGESLWLISQKYHVPLTEILKLNKNLKDPAMIYPGQKVVVPDNNGTNTTQPNKAEFSSEALAVLKLVNQERQKSGLDPLELNAPVTNVANVKAKDMAVNNYFSHNSPTYGTPFQMLKSFGIHYMSAGENIAAGQRTPEEVMKSWLNSPGHRENILRSSFTHIGVGYYKGGSYGHYWVQQFIGN